jgi:hypothetical protein
MQGRTLLYHVMARIVCDTIYFYNWSTCRYSLESHPAWKRRQAKLSELDQAYSGWLEYVPWFLKCNPRRYPYWFGASDQRNRALLYVLKKLSMGQTYVMAEYLHQRL